jgi:predicted esterase
VRRALILFGLTASAVAESQPAGRIIDRVVCEADAEQSYALYLPSKFTPDRQWPVIFAFDPRARGRIPVERFQPAAEKYGYIVAGSNNSRNGPWEPNTVAVRAMTEDVQARFPIDSKRVYTSGFSGGARVAMQVALSTGKIAGVIAAGAGFPDARPRRTVHFAVFGVAGTEDFNYLEIRQLERELRSPGRFSYPAAGHAWFSTEVAMDAIEWMQIQSGLAGDGLFRSRLEAANGITEPVALCIALQHLAQDFPQALEVEQRPAEACRSKQVKDGLKKQRVEIEREQRVLDELLRMEAGIEDLATRAVSVADIRRRLTELLRDATGQQDSPDRRIARRVFPGFVIGSMDRTRDPDYRKLLEELRIKASPWPPNR